MRRKVITISCALALILSISLLIFPVHFSCGANLENMQKIEYKKDEQIAEIINYSKRGFQMRLANVNLIGSDPVSIEHLLNQYDYIIDQKTRTVFFVEKEHTYYNFR